MLSTTLALRAGSIISIPQFGIYIKLIGPMIGYVLPYATEPYSLLLFLFSEKELLIS